MPQGPGQPPGQPPGAVVTMREALDEICEEEFDETEEQELAAMQQAHPGGRQQPNGFPSERRSPQSPHLRPEAAREAAVAQLQLLLPVLNGLVYSHDLHRQVCLREGLSQLLALLSDAAPLLVHEQALHLLHNAFFDKVHHAARPSLTATLGEP